MTNVEKSDVVKKAKRGVAAQAAALTSNLHDVEESAKNVLAQASAQSKPILIAGAVVVGVVIVGKLISSAFGPRRPRSYFFSPQPSIASTLVRSAAVLVARGTVRKLAEVAVAKLGAAATQSLGAPAPGAPPPSPPAATV